MNIIEMCGNQKPRNTELVDYCIEFLHHELQKIQEGHIFIGHILCGLIEDTLF